MNTQHTDILNVQNLTQPDFGFLKNYAKKSVHFFQVAVIYK